jgi:hypothetical protein
MNVSFVACKLLNESYRFVGVVSKVLELCSSDPAQREMSRSFLPLVTELRICNTLRHETR